MTRVSAQVRPGAVALSSGGSAEPEPTPQLTSFAITSDVGKVFAKPSEDGSAGPYYPQNWPATMIPAAWAAAGIERVYTWSTDHDGSNGGIYFGYRKAGVYKNHTEAAAAGWLDGLNPPYTSNPIYGGARQNPAGFTQIETAWTMKPDATYATHASANNTTASRGTQHTFRGTGTDPWRVALPAVLASAVLVNPENEGIIGDGQTTYLRFGARPAGSSFPYAFFGWSLGGGGAKSCAILWGTNDPVAGVWSIVDGANGFAGRVYDIDYISAIADMRISVITADPASIRPVGDGTYSMLCSVSGVAFGGSARKAGLVEIRLSNDLSRIIGIASAAIKMPTGSGFNSEEVSEPSIYISGNDFEVIYTATDASNQNSIGELRGTLLDPADTQWIDLGLTDGVESYYNLRGLPSAIPAGLNLNLLGTPVDTVNAYGADGLSLRTTGNATARTSESAIYHAAGFVPADHNAVLWFVEDQKCQTGGARTAEIMMGLATQKNIAFASQTDMLLIANFRAGQAANGSTLYKRVHRANVEESWAASTLHYGLGAASTNKAFNRAYGLLLLPQEKRLIVLGEGRHELEEFAIPADWNMATRLYPFWTSRTNAVTALNSFERVGALQLKID